MIELPKLPHIPVIEKTSVSVLGGTVVVELVAKDVVEGLIRSYASAALAAQAEKHAAELSQEPTAEMIAAYLNANRAYWQRIDAEPGVIGRWRNGTAEEATEYSLSAALTAQAEAHAAATSTLKQLGYTYHGGEQWKPPIGKKPDFDQIDQLVTERDALRAENERLFTAVNDWIYANGPNGWIDALRAEVEALRADAERYRWLTDDHHKQETRAMAYQIGSSLNVRGKGHIDAAIDAARVAKGQG